MIIKSVGNKDYVGVHLIENNGSDTLNLSTNTSLREIGCVGLKAKNLRSPFIADLEGNGMGGLVYIATAYNYESDVGIYYDSCDAVSQKLSQSSQKVADLPDG